MILERSRVALAQTQKVSLQAVQVVTVQQVTFDKTQTRALTLLVHIAQRVQRRRHRIGYSA